MSSSRFVIVLLVTVDDPDDDPRLWPWADLLAPPPGEQDRHVSYVYGMKEA